MSARVLFMKLKYVKYIIRKATANDVYAVMMKNNTNTLKRALYKNIILMVLYAFLIFGKNTKNQFALLIINHREQTAITHNVKR